MQRMGILYADFTFIRPFADVPLDARLEEVYSRFARTSKSGLERVTIDKPDIKSRLGAELSDYICWEIYGAIKENIAQTELYISPLTGNYVMQLRTIKPSIDMKYLIQKINERFFTITFCPNLSYGGPPIQNIKPHLLKVESEGEFVDFVVEMVMPASIRYHNLAHIGHTLGFTHVYGLVH